MKKEDAKRMMEKLKEDYDLMSFSFAKTRDRLWPEMKFLFDRAREGEDVLDIGCGNGRFSQYLERVNYTGVDFSRKMIEEAQARFPEKNFLDGDILSLPFKENSFDKVYCIAVIHQIPSFEYRLQAMQEIERVLKPGGIIFATAWNIWKRNKIFCIKKMVSNFFFSRSLGPRDIILKRDRYYYVFRKKELSHLAEKAGLVAEEEGLAEEGKRSNFYLVARKKEASAEERKRVFPK